MAVRAKLRRSTTVPGDEAASAESTPQPLAPCADPAEPAPGRRTRPGLLLVAGIALLAGGAYLLVHALKAATPQRMIPERSEPGRQPPSVNPGPEHGLADPAPRAEGGKDDAAG